MLVVADEVIAGKTSVLDGVIVMLCMEGPLAVALGKAQSGQTEVEV